MPNPAHEKIADRIEAFLNVGLAALREGDKIGALLAFQEADKVAQELKRPPDVIHLPDLTKGA